MGESFPKIKESHLTHIHVATDILRSQLLKEQMWSPVNLVSSTSKKPHFPSTILWARFS